MKVKIFNAPSSEELEKNMNEWLSQVNDKVLGMEYHILQRTDMQSTAVFSVLVSYEE